MQEQPDSFENLLATDVAADTAAEAATAARPGLEELDNGTIGDLLEEVAERLEAQHANPFRVRGYRLASQTVRNLDQPLTTVLERDGVLGLMRLPHVGVGLGRALERLLHTGALELLERLRHETAPEDVIATIPGIGPELADRIHHELGIESLAQLETAALDGRLERVPGLGKRRVQAIRESLAGRLHQHDGYPVHAHRPGEAEPSVAELLSIDAEYREKAESDRLRRIAPRRFNPSGTAWLPLLQTEREGRHYAAHYSNSPRAHAMGTTHDWVVIRRDEADGEPTAWTVVTANLGALRGRRIVRGQEAACRSYYRVGRGRPLSRQ